MACSNSSTENAFSTNAPYAEEPVTGSCLGAELLRTHRLVMRRIVNADIPDLRILDGDPRVTEMLLDQPVKNLPDALALVAYVNYIYKEYPGLGIWHTRDRQDRFLGHFSLMPIEQSQEIEIGVKLLPCAWGRAYALEGGKSLCNYAFDKLGLTQLVGLCHPENRVIPILLGRLGFVAHGVTVHFNRPAFKFRLTARRWIGRGDNG